MSNISLQGSIRGCRVDAGWANKIQSDRFENPALMSCPTWNGSDTYGRQVCPDSFNTKNAGCNSPADRIYVENVLRPQYIEYITLDAQGITGNMFEEDSNQRSTDLRNLKKVTGSTGVGYGGIIATSCGSYRYDDAQAQIAKANAQRANNQFYNQARTYSDRAASGNHNQFNKYRYAGFSV
jgi:hypothetical protein